MNKWISIETPPEKCGQYLVVRNYKCLTRKIQSYSPKNILSDNKEDHKPRFYNQNGLVDKYVTHWMPLPEFPK